MQIVTESTNNPLLIDVQINQQNICRFGNLMLAEFHYIYSTQIFENSPEFRQITLTDFIQVGKN